MRTIATMLLLSSLLTPRLALGESAQSTPTATSSEAPAISGSLTAETFSGQLTASIPFNVAPFRKVNATAATLFYRSQATHGVSGIGWDLPATGIYLDVARGTDWPRKRYLFKFAGQAIPLVEETAGTYFAQHEGLFFRFTLEDGSTGKTWTAHNRFGGSFVFGTSSDHRLLHGNETIAWLLQELKDPSQVRVQYDWILDGNVPALKEVRYLDEAGVVRRRATFVYEARPDVQTWVSGSITYQIQSRLAGVSIFAEQQATRAFRLRYAERQAGIAGPVASLLSSVVTEAAEAPGESAQVFAAEYASIRRDGLLRPLQNDDPTGQFKLKECRSGDFSGSGSQVLACHGDKEWRFFTLHQNGWKLEVAVPSRLDVSNVNQSCLSGDFDADNATDLLCESAGGTLALVSLAGAKEIANWSGDPSGDRALASWCTGLHINRDGVTDVACIAGRGSDTKVGLTHAQGLEVHAWSDGPYNGAKIDAGGGGIGLRDLPNVPFANRCFAADASNLQADTVYCETGGMWQAWRANPNATGWSKVNTQLAVGGDAFEKHCIVGDYFGRVSVSIACWNEGKKWTIHALDGAVSTSLAIDGPQLTGEARKNCVLGDFNAGRATDLACFNSESRKVEILLAADANWVTLSLADADVANLAPAEDRCLASDLEGFGYSDLACRANGGWVRFFSESAVSGVLASVTNEYGGVESFSYQPSSSTTDSRVAAVAVLSAIRKSDGLGGVEVRSFAYSGGRYNPRDRTFRGFGSITTTLAPSGESSGSSRREVFHQGDFVATELSSQAPLVGKLVRVETLTASGEIIETEDRTYAIRRLGQRKFGYLEGSIRSVCGATCVPVTRTRFTFDDYGNLLTQHTEVKAGSTWTVSDVEKTYKVNTERWLISLLGSEQVSTIESGLRRILSRSEYFYDGSGDCGQGQPSLTPDVGRLTRVVQWVTDDERATRSFGHDRVGQVVCLLDALGHRTRYTFDDSSTFVLAITNALGHTARFSYYGVGDGASVDSQFGLLKSSADPNGLIARYRYDGQGRIVESWESAGGTKKTIRFEHQGDPTQQRRIEVGPSGTRTARLDGFGRTTTVTSTLGDKRNVRSGSRYWGDFVVEVDQPRFADAQVSVTTRFAYDALGALAKVRFSDGRVHRYCSRGLVSISEDDQNVRRVTLYDGAGRTIATQTYTRGKGYWCDFDKLSPAPDSLPSSDGLYFSSSRAYDATGRLIAESDSVGNVRTFTYDLRGYVTSISDPDRGFERQVRDQRGSVVEVRDGSGRATFLSYDPIGRLEQRDWQSRKPADAADERRYYDENDNGIGRLSRVVRADKHGASYRYDRMGRVVETVLTLGKKKTSTARVYDEQDRLQKLTYPDGSSVIYTYEGPFVRTVSYKGQQLALAESHSESGMPGRITYGNGSVGSFDFFTPESAVCRGSSLKLCRAKWTATNWNIGISYSYDNSGRLALRRDERNAYSSVYVYDELGRLWGEVYSTGDAVVPQLDLLSISAQDIAAGKLSGLLSSALPGARIREARAWDRAGNPVWTSDKGIIQYPSTAGSAVRPHAATRVLGLERTYDGAGRIQADGRFTYDYDPAGKLSQARSLGRVIKFEYDALDRIASVRGGEDGDSVQTGSLVRCIKGTCHNVIYLGHTPIALVNKNEIFYLHFDHVGSTIGISKADTLSVSGEYSAFGSVVSEVRRDQAAPRTGFLGEYKESSTNLIWLGQRYYDPGLGVFLAPEPLDTRADGLLQNPYLYALGDPVHYTDSDGAFPWAIVAVGALIGAVQAHAHGDNVLEGALRGATAGVIIASGTALAAPLQLGTTGSVLVASASGAMAGATTAAIWGGDVQESARNGAIMGAIGYGLSGTEIELFSNSSGWGGTANYLVNSSVRGALWGASYNAATGQDPVDGALAGADLGWKTGLGYSALGHAWGLGVSGGKQPGWDASNKMFTYRINESQCGFCAGISIGNTTTGFRLDALTTNTPQVKIVNHEAAHRSQYYDLAPKGGYFYAHALSQGVSVLVDGHSHSANLLENYWIDVRY